jgi:Calcineurin-like phosphoesterase
LQEEIVSDFGNTIGQARRIKELSLFLLIFLIPFPSHAGSIRDVSQSLESVKSIEAPVQFAVLGDSRDGKRVYSQFIQRIMERKPHFIVHLGDMIRKPSEKEWREFFEISKTIDIPFFPVIGNHEVAGTTRGEEIYRKQFALPDGKTYYAFQTGDALFVIVDSERGKEKIKDEQWSWLRDMLSLSDAPLKMVFIHRPLFVPPDSFKQGKAMDRYPSARDDLHQLFVKTKVKAVFQGDDHRYDRMEKDRILYIITGGGGAPLYAPKDSGGYFHYVWVSIQKGRLEGEVVNLDGQIKDRFVIVDGKGE